MTRPKIEFDDATQTMTIEGNRYSYEFFEIMGKDKAGTIIELGERQDGTVTLITRYDLKPIFFDGGPDIIFFCPDGKERIRITAESFIVDGEPVDVGDVVRHNQEVYKTFREWMGDRSVTDKARIRELELRLDLTPKSDRDGA